MLYDEPGPGVDLGLKASFLDSLGEAVIGTDARGRIVYWNDASTRMYGWSAEEVIGSHILDITPAEEMRESAARILGALRRGESWSGELLTRHRDGTEFPVIVTNSPVLDGDGELVGVVGISRDISGQREAETALRTSEERLHLVRRAAQSVIWEMDTATGKVEWSSALGDVFGYDPAEIEPTIDWWLRQVHPDDRAWLGPAFDSFLTDEQQFWTQEYRFRRADGSYADVFDRAYATPDAGGEKVRIAGAMIDLTERRRLQDERRLLAQAGMILDLSMDYEATLPTLARLVTNVMADVCLIHLMPAAHVHPFTASAHADPAQQTTLEDVASQLSATPAESSITGRVIREREPVLLSNVPRELHENPGVPGPLRDLVLQLGPTSLMVLPVQGRLDVLGFMILGNTGMRSPYDQSDLRMAEELARRIGTAIDHARLYEAEQLANRAKADFLAVMSHELRTPLTAVLGYADLLAGEVSGSLNERQKAQVQRIRAGTDRLHRLIESILMYVRLETGTERPGRSRVHLGDMLERVREIVEPRASEEALEFRIETGDVPDHISTDPDRFLQVLLALLTNALKFSREGTIVLRAERRDGHLVMDVSDSGHGIPEEHQPYVFNAFWQVEQPSTRRAGGAGLGLSVARRLARLLDGDVTIADSSPSGTTFRFRLPLDQRD
jgi:PAS domain S-box-containing protein